MRWPPSPGLLSLITLREANHIYITAGSLDLELKELKKLHVQCVPSTWVSWPWIAIIMWNMCQWYDAQDTVTRLTRLQFPCFTAGTDSQCCAAHQNQPTAGRLQLRWRHAGSAIYYISATKIMQMFHRRVRHSLRTRSHDPPPEVALQGVLTRCLYSGHQALRNAGCSQSDVDWFFLASLNYLQRISRFSRNLVWNQ